MFAYYKLHQCSVVQQQCNIVQINVYVVVCNGVCWSLLDDGDHLIKRCCFLTQELFATIFYSFEY